MDTEGFALTAIASGAEEAEHPFASVTVTV